MKILQVIPYFTPKRGGDVNVCYNLSRELIKKGHEVTILTTDFEFDGGYANSIEGLKVIPFKCVANLSLFLYSPEMKEWIKNNIDKFDVVHLHQLRSYQNNIIHEYATKYNVPYVLQPHGSTSRKTGKGTFKWLYDKFFGHSILKDASRVIAVSKEEAGYDHEIGALKEKIDVIYNGMDLSSFENLPQYGNFRRKYGINGKMILYLGRIHKLKGIDFVLKSFSGLTKKIEDATLVIAGPDDGYKKELEKLIEELDLQHKIKFTGFLNDNDKISAYVDADLFVHTVLYMGGVGITPLESILCNTPVIVTSGCGEVIEDANAGYIVKYGDVDDLKEKIEYVLKNPQEAQKTVENGKKYVLENLNWKDVVDKIENIYKELV